MAAAGEPWFSYFTPEGIAGELRSLGLAEVEDLSAAELVAGYLDDPAEFRGEPPSALRASRILRAGRSRRGEEGHGQGRGARTEESAATEC